LCFACEYFLSNEGLQHLDREGCDIMSLAETNQQYLCFYPCVSTGRILDGAISIPFLNPQ
jgi:hypothetical protein